MNNDAYAVAVRRGTLWGGTVGRGTRRSGMAGRGTRRGGAGGIIGGTVMRADAGLCRG